MIHGILSDAHGNRECFELALSLLERLGAAEFLFLGDAVGYLPGAAVVRALAASGMSCIRGNHDEMLVSGAVDPDRDRIYRHAQTRRDLGESELALMAAWPASTIWVAASGPVLAVHGSPAEPTHGYVYPDTDLSTFDVATGTTVFMGHTHRPFVGTARGVRYVNVGSCGLPRDAGGLGCAALFDDETGGVRLIRFDIRDAVRAALARVGPVDDSVLAIFRRPAPTDLVGELHDA